MPFGDEDESGEARPAVAPAPDATSGFRKLAVKPPARGNFAHPPAYRGVVALWPVEWRERWGIRSNALEDEGLSWRDAETQAFVELWNQLRNEPSGHSAATSSPETVEV
jgi:hypothetical protein